MANSWFLSTKNPAVPFVPFFPQQSLSRWSGDYVRQNPGIKQNLSWHYHKLSRTPNKMHSGSKKISILDFLHKNCPSPLISNPLARVLSLFIINRFFTVGIASVGSITLDLTDLFGFCLLFVSTRVEICGTTKTEIHPVGTSSQWPVINKQCGLF